MSKNYILAIDQGTTGSRAIIFDLNGNKILSSYKEFPQYFPKPAWVEHDPDEIWESVNYVIQDVLKKINPDNIRAIGITNQRETTIVWDKITGKPIYNAIVWQCRRTAQRCEQIKKDKKFLNYIKQKTGLPVDAYFSATKIEWILKSVKNRKISGNGNLLFGTPDSWILWKLTGGKTHATDFTNASRTMLFDIREKKWDSKLLNYFGIPRSMLPEVKKSSGFFGKTIRIGKLPQGVPITGIAGDQQAALFGQECFSKGDVKNTYGTGCFMLLNTGKKFIISKNGLITTIACDKNGDPCYAFEGSVFIAGAAVQWLRDGIKIIASSSETENLSLSLKDNEGVYFVPAFVGLGAPYWLQNVKGIICGLTRGTKREHLARAAIESMCYQTKDVLIAMQRDANIKIKSLKADGGATSNKFLCQFQSDILQIPLKKAKIIETTSLGVAHLAALGANLKFSLSGKNYEEFYPKSDKSIADKYYNNWKIAVKSAIIASQSHQ